MKGEGYVADTWERCHIPDRKTAPATATGMERAKAVAVARAISSVVTLTREGCFRPG
jgi:hypothetical protein